MNKCILLIFLLLMICLMINFLKYDLEKFKNYYICYLNKHNRRKCTWYNTKYQY